MSSKNTKNTKSIKKGTKIKQVYKKMDQIDHVLARPEVYIGSTIPKDIEDFVVVDDAFHIQKRTINISPAFLRIFIEPLSNIVDNVARSKVNKNPVTKISINIDEETGETTFWNDGDIIPVEIHEEEKCYNHTLIFGHLLTSSNYDDSQERVDISGKNGLGGKAVNIFSTSFTVEGIDPDNQKSFKQTWSDNMKTVSDPIVKPTKLTQGYTKITYTPDFKQFSIQNYSPEIISYLKRLVVDVAMLTKVKTYFNGDEIPINNLVDYSKLFSKEDQEDPFLNIKTPTCDVVLTLSHSQEFEAISFASGIYTPLGGVHVDAWSEALFRPILDKLNKPKKPALNISDVKKFFRLFVVATVVNPKYDHQSKMRLESPTVEAKVLPIHVKKILNWSVIDLLNDLIHAKEMVVLKKVERKKRGYEKVEKLEPANLQGGKTGHQCILIVVEGDSAKTHACHGIQKGFLDKVGRDYIGIYTLRGKLLNCRKAKPVNIAKNKVVTDIIKIIGLQYGTDYSVEENYRKLQYGKFAILTDADVDGIHISSLLMNMFHHMFPSLLSRPEPFIVSIQTPIVKVVKNKKDIWFYDEDEYKKYVSEHKGEKIDKKYYKGLGSSSKADILDTFGNKLVQFKLEEKCSEELTKAFSDKLANTRKEWIGNYDPTKKVLLWKGNDPELQEISYGQFIDTELIKFSIDDCKRSIPSLMDGLKQGHRKVLYTILGRKAQRYSGGTPIKVAQLAGDVALKTNYHHGEDNLHKTIAHMAQSYVGSNNIPLLTRDGQFGSRSEGGKDASAGRYIWTKVDELTRLIFKEEDDVILTQLEEDGDKIEPEVYIPIIPMVLVNGVIAGIGTGWSSKVPAYNPLDLIASIKVWLENDGNVIQDDLTLLPEIKPWYRAFTGEIEDIGKGTYSCTGTLTRNKNHVIVTELPVFYWTSDFADNLETMKEEKKITNYKNHSTPDTVYFDIVESDTLCDVDSLGLVQKINTTNMVLFSSEGRLKKYKNTDEIIDEFCQVRYAYYQKRKNHILNTLETRIKYLGNKKRFLEEVRDGVIKLFEEGKEGVKGGKRQSRKTADLVQELEKRGYDRDDTGEEKEEKEDDEDKQEPDKPTKSGYNYLLRQQISSITAEKINKLKNDIDSTIKEKEELESTSTKDIWIKELEVLEKAYKVYEQKINKELNDTKNEEKGKKTTKKGKK